MVRERLKEKFEVDQSCLSSGGSLRSSAALLHAYDLHAYDLRHRRVDVAPDQHIVRAPGPTCRSDASARRSVIYSRRCM
jgi:hypothetical protein